MINPLKWLLAATGLCLAAQSLANNPDESDTKSARQSEPASSADSLKPLYDAQMAAYKSNDRKAAAEASGKILEILNRPPDSDTVIYAFALNNHAMNLSNLGKTGKALPLFRQSWQLYTRLVGARHADTLLALNNYVSALDDLGQTKEAATLYPQLIASRQEVLGSDHPDTLVSTANYVYFLTGQGHYAEALPLSREVVDRTIKANGSEDANSLVVRNNHAALLQKSGALREARDIYAEILDIRERTLGAGHPDTMVSISNLAFAEQALGRLQQAAPLFARALELSEAIYGPDHPSTLISRNNQAGIFEAMGRLDDAETLYFSVLESRRRIFGPEHPKLIISLNNYAGILNAQGKTSEAERFFGEALGIARKSLSASHPDTLNALQNYATLLKLQGRVAEARPLFEEAVRIQLETLGPDHPDTLNSKNSLGLLLVAAGDIAGARKLLSETLDGRRKVLGREHPDTIVSLNNHAALLNAAGNPAEAEPLYAEALALHRKTLGNTHPNTIVSISNYAYILDILKRRTEAEEYYLEAVDLSRKILDDRHPDFAQRLGDLAYVQLAQPERAGIAIDQARAAAKIISARREATGFTPSDQAQIDRDIGRQSFYFKLLADAAWAAAQTKGTAAALSVAFRKEAFEAMQEAMSSRTTQAIAQTAARNHAAQAGDDLGALVQQREALTGQWAEAEKQRIASFAEPDAAASGKIEELRIRQDELAAQINRVDDLLQKNAPAYFALVRPKPLPENETQQMLATDEAALLIVPTDFGTHVMVITREKMAWQKSVLTDSEIDLLVRRLLWDVGADIVVDAIDAAEWGNQGKGAYPFARKVANGLYNELIAPVDHELAGKTHVFIAASGSLTSLPFGLLVTEKPVGDDGDPEALRATKWFADAYALTVIPSLQSLQFLRQPEQAGVRPTDRRFVGFGDPKLEGRARTRGLGRKSGVLRSGGAPALSVGELARNGSTGLSEIRNMARLPGTAQELRAIWQAFGRPDNALFLAERATEAQVKAIDFGATDVISFATHGVVAGELSGQSEPGLVFTPPDNATEVDDGLLTASEVAGLRLNADWVILSACNTAAGDGQDGAPGLSGLARSFFYAGAKNLLASHWPVRDDVAAIVTVRTVQIAQDNPALSRAQAFQQAIREIRNNSNSDSSRDTWAHPEAWAPFSLIGDR